MQSAARRGAGLREGRQSANSLVRGGRESWMPGLRHEHGPGVTGQPVPERDELSGPNLRLGAPNQIPVR